MQKHHLESAKLWSNNNHAFYFFQPDARREQTERRIGLSVAGVGFIGLAVIPSWQIKGLGTLLIIIGGALDTVAYVRSIEPLRPDIARTLRCYPLLALVVWIRKTRHSGRS